MAGEASSGRRAVPSVTQRLQAFARDALLVAGYSAGLAGGGLIITKLSPGTLDEVFGTRWTSQAIASGVFTLPVIVTLGLADAGGAGFGKRSTGLQIERSGGGPPGHDCNRSRRSRTNPPCAQPTD